MAVGMTMVFIFLIVLILMMHVIHLVDARFFPELPVSTDGGVSEGEIVAVITAAVHKHIRSRSED